jgi:glycosyltransferase involved in cell wall biosynthesis
VNPRPRILFFQRSVPPDHSAAGALLFDLGKALAGRGWDVWIAGTRTDPGAADREDFGGVHFVRSAAPRVSKASLASRALALPGTWLAMLRAVRACPQPDILVTMTDPPLSVCAGALLARRAKCRHVHWCQDLYPQVAAAAGLLNPRGPVCRAMQYLATASLRDCAAVIAVGRCMRDQLARAGVASTLVPNWSRIAPLDQPPPRDGFRILYSGNLGRAHDFEGLRSAAALTGSGPGGVTWTVCGDGPQSAVIGEGIERIPPVAWSRFPALLASAHAHLITLRSEFSGLVVPSKLYDAAASGRPIIFAGPKDSECARAIEEHGLGIVVPDRDGPALAAAAETLSANPALYQDLCSAARKFGEASRLDPAAFDRLFRSAH